MSIPNWTFLPTCGQKCKNEYLRILKTEIWTDERKEEINAKVATGVKRSNTLEKIATRTESLKSTLKSRGADIKDQRRQTSLERHNDPTYSNSKTASNTRLNFNHKRKDEINEKRAITNEKLYGKFHILGSTTSKFERDVIDHIGNFALRSYLHKRGQYYIGTASDYYLYDLVNEHTKKIIEFNGDYWHANPKIYSAEQILGKGLTKKTVKEIWDKDAKKIQAAKNRGFEVLTVWESDFYKNPQAEVERCLNWLRE